MSFERDEFKRRLAFAGRTATDVVRELQARGTACDQARLSRAMAGERAPALDRIRQGADAVTLSWMLDRKRAMETKISAELACLGLSGKVSVRIPDDRTVPVYLDGELFGLYDERTNRML